MSKPIIYLAGPIAGARSSDAFDWRDGVEPILEDAGVQVLSPLRGKSKLAADGTIAEDYRGYQHNGPLYTPGGIMRRDCNDVRRADLILANLAYAVAGQESKGTIMELGWAWLLATPVVAWIESAGSPYDKHPMIHEAIGPFREAELGDAVDLALQVLGV